MKKTAKVFIIIGMIVGFWMVVPIIIGAKNLKRIANDEPLTVGSKVIILLFVSTIAGIILLCDRSDDARLAAMAGQQTNRP